VVVPTGSGLTTGGQDLTHLFHRSRQSLLDPWRKRHPLLDTTRQDHHAKYRPNPINLLNEQALCGDLKHVRRVQPARAWFLLHRNEHSALPDQVIGPPNQAETPRPQCGSTQPRIVRGDDRRAGDP